MLGLTRLTIEKGQRSCIFKSQHKMKITTIKTAQQNNDSLEPGLLENQTPKLNYSVSLFTVVMVCGLSFPGKRPRRRWTDFSRFLPRS